MLSDEQMLEKVSEELKVGMELKNYKELCEILEQPVRTGNSKKSQLSEWKRFFDWEQRGHKFVITEVYDKPLINKENRGGAREIIPYIKNIEVLLINLLALAKENRVLISKNLLLEELSMVNQDYFHYLFETELLREETGIEKEYIDEFFDKTYSLLQRNLKTALDKLKNDLTLEWNDIIVVVVPDKGQNQIHREATNNEYEIIMEAKIKVLEEMGLTKEWQALKFGRREEYNSKVNELLHQKYNILYQYRAYEIILNRSKVKDDWLKLDSDKKLFHENQLNSGVLERNLKLAQDRHINARKRIFLGRVKEEFKLLELRSKDDYVNKFGELNNRLIKS